MEKQQLLAQGAEAKIFLHKNVITKRRIKKTYRHPVLDEQLRKRRTKREAKLLQKAKEAKVNVPNVIDTKKYYLDIEFINGERLSETLNSYEKKKQFSVMKQLGKQVALLHDNNIIHGDLTTSNVILCDNKVFVIDFGLGFVSRKIEDKAVDLHLIKQAIDAKHWQNHEALFKAFLQGYQTTEKDYVLTRLQTVERRGRYRH